MSRTGWPMLAAAIMLAACGGSGDPPADQAVLTAVGEAVHQRPVAVRVIDLRIAQAKDWKLDKLDRVALLRRPVPDGVGIWRVRVAITGTWSGQLPVPQPDALPDTPPVYRPARESFDCTAELRIIADPDGSAHVP